MSETHTLSDLLRVAEEFWPASTAESWDRVGLVTGDPRAPIQKIMLAVDAVEATISEAIDCGADVLLTHHPLLLRGVHSVAENTAKGAALAKLIRADCALIAAHTNADQPLHGISDVIAKQLGLLAAVPIVQGIDESSGLGRVGDLPVAEPLQTFAERVSAILPETVSGVRVAGDPARLVQRVALLGGAGDSLLDHPLVRGADVYLTSDLRHHPAQEAIELALTTGGPALVDVAHWASESLWLRGAAERIAAELPGLQCVVSTQNTDPWRFSVGASQADVS